MIGVRTLITSTLLIGFTLLVGIACVIALASTLTQARISGLAIDGVALNIWKLDSIREQWASLRQQQRQQSDELANSDKERLALIRLQSVAIENFNSADETLSDLIQTLSFRIQSVDSQLASTLNSDATPQEKVARLNALQSALRANTELGLASLLDQIGRAYELYRAELGKKQSAQAQLNALVQRIESLQKALRGSQESLKAVFGSIKGNLDEPTRARIENALYELNPSNSRISRLMNGLITLQPDVLALSLVILMGILGSSLQILHSFFRAHRVEPIGSYFLRISVGAIAALVIFIVAKAGIPVIADASKLSGDAPINPYFISFLAIITGLLSERAIITVQNQGERFFSSGTSEPARWARVDLEPDMQQQNLTAKTLADYLGIPEADVKKILRGQERADFAQQRTIAIYLRRSIRDLFTDIPPA
jgi:transcriptional regulator with XRE-family HTH domain